jgi:PAS domain S-box-containing protein
MESKKNFLLLGLIMVLVAIGVGGITIWVLYVNHIEDSRNRLIEIVESRARLMESIANFDSKHRVDYPGGAVAATLSQVSDAHKHFSGFGDTGEFTLAKRVDEQIIFVLRHRHSNLDKPEPVPFSGKIAEPMRRALSGKSGSVVGLDYRGVEVLAAFEPVVALGVGVVAKIDMVEVQAQFIGAGMLLLFSSLGIICVGGIVFYWTSRPLLQRISEHQRLGRILEESINEIYVFDITTYKFSTVNAGAQRNLGYSLAQLLQMAPWDLILDVSELELKNMVQPLLNNEKSQLTFEVEHQRQDGSLYPVEVRLQLFHHEDPAVFVAIILDLSNKKAMEKSLRETEASHSITLNSIGDAVISTDREGRIVFINPVAERLTGWSLIEARQRHVSEVFHIISSITREPSPNPVDKVLESGAVVGLANHTSLIARDKTERQIADSGAPILDYDGTIMGVVLVFRDVTDEYHNREILRRSMEMSQKYLDIAGVMFATLDKDGIITLINKKGGAILGYDPSELIGQDWFSTCLPQRMSQDVREVFARLINGEIELVEYYENHVMHRDGSERLIAFHNTVVRDNSGQIEAVLFSGEDITERNRAESELNRSNRALKALSSASEALVHAVDEIQFMNNLCQLIVERAGYHLVWIGFADDDAVKSVRPVAQFGYEEGYLDTLNLTWADSPRGRGPTGIAIRTGAPSITRDIHNDPNFAPWREQAIKRGYKSAMGLPLIIEGKTIGALNVYASESDAFNKDEARFLANLANDVSFGIRSLREHMNNRRLASAVEQTGDMVLVSNTSGVIQYINRAFSLVTGYMPEEMVGKNVRMLRSDKSSEKNFEDMWYNLAQGQSWKGHFINEKKDGSLFQVEASISPIKSPEGSMKSYVAVYRDITKQLAMEQQLRQAQKMESIGTLAGGISHDFNNLLGIILGYTELVLDQIPQEDQRHKDLQDVFLAGKRARDLVAQLLTFSRRTEGETKAIKISPILKESIKFMRATLPSTIEINTHILDSDVTISVDPTQLHQVIMNLCTNAAFAMDEDGGVMDITLERADIRPEEISEIGLMPVSSYAVLTIKDSGTGISADIQSRLFDPFFTTKEVGKGTGLGLAVVHGIVSSAKGFIKVESAPGKGAAFRVYWPMVKEDIDHKGAVAVIAKPVKSHRVLFVDDEISIARLGETQLDKLGYRVESFTDSKKAWERFQESPEQFEVVISDQTMPGMTGIELFKRIQTLNANIPKILCSGKKSAIPEEQIKELDIRAYLRKPFLIEDLAQALHDIFYKV